MMSSGLFDGFDAAQIGAIEAQLAADKLQDGVARATRARQRHELRRANAEKHLADILPARFDDGDSWHVISRGDIDALSYLRHALAGVSHFDHVLMSTWCIARADAYHLVIESSANVNTNPRIEQSTIHRSTDLYAFYAEFFDGIRSIDRRA